MGISRGTVLQIQRMSTEDGPGLRSTAFLKGCPPRLRLVPQSREHLRQGRAPVDRPSLHRGLDERRLRRLPGRLSREGPEPGSRRRPEHRSGEMRRGRGMRSLRQGLSRGSPRAPGEVHDGLRAHGRAPQGPRLLRALRSGRGDPSPGVRRAPRAASPARSSASSPRPGSTRPSTPAATPPGTSSRPSIPT